MYEKLSNRLRERSVFLFPHHGESRNYDADLMREAADAIEELICEVAGEHNARLDAEERQRWIPVAERLPEAGERVLCYCRAKIYEVMKMRTDGDWVCDTNHVYMHSFVTHWMPLPQPPKEET